MTLVVDKFRSLLPRFKTSPSGWMSFNAPCCHHRGHRTDNRKRAGVVLTEGIIYNCFNCIPLSFNHFAKKHVLAS